MSSFGDFPQGSVSAGYQPGSMPGPGSDGVAQPRRSRLLMAAILALSLLVVVGVVVLLFVLGASRSHSEPSLANGLKVSLDKLVVIQVESDDEGVAVSRPYSVFLPGGDLAVFAPAGEKVYYNVVRQDTGSKVSPGKAKISWPEDADESGGVLEPCESGQRYVLEADTVTCAEVDAPQAAGEKEGFGQVLYSGKDLRIVAAPGVDNAKALSGFSPEGKLLWSKELATPGQVSFDGSRVIVTSFEGSKVSIEGYGAVEESQKPTESPTLVEAAKAPDKDAIKDFDYKNSFAPFAYFKPGVDCHHDDTNRPVLRKIPDTNDGCWSNMVEGESQERLPWDDSAPLLTLSNFEEQYVDINADGYTDLLLVGNSSSEGGFTFAYIFDPTDPEHPYSELLEWHQDETYGMKYMGHGEFETAITGVFDKRCVTRRFRIENDANGVPRVVDYEEVDDDATDEEGCL